MTTVRFELFVNIERRNGHLFAIERKEWSDFTYSYKHKHRQDRIVSCQFQG